MNTVIAGPRWAEMRYYCALCCAPLTDGLLSRSRVTDRVAGRAWQSKHPPRATSPLSALSATSLRDCQLAETYYRPVTGAHPSCIAYEASGSTSCVWRNYESGTDRLPLRDDNGSRALCVQ